MTAFVDIKVDFGFASSSKSMVHEKMKLGLLFSMELFILFCI